MTNVTLLDGITAFTRTVPGANLSLRFLAGARQVGCTINTEDQGEDGVVLVSAGMDFQNFIDRNPIILYSHDPQRPVARAVEVNRIGTEIRAVAQFPEPGVSADSDLVYGLIKAGIINSVSTGFVALETVPLRNGMSGRRITRSRLLEFSFVAIPALPSAVVTARAFRPAGNTNRGSIAVRQALALQRKTWFAGILAEDRRERAERLAARLRREGYIE